MKNNSNKNSFIDLQSCENEIKTEKPTNDKKIDSVKIGKIALWCGAALVLLCILLVIFLVGDVTATIDGDTLKVEASLTQSKKVSISDIESVTLASSFTKGSKELGSDLYRINAGTFINNDYGRFKLYVYNNVSKYAVVKTKSNSYLIFNLKTESETANFVTKLQEKLA